MSETPPSHAPAVSPAGEPPARPGTVDTAFWMTLVGTAIGAVGAALTLLLDRDWVTATVRQVLVDSGTPVTDAELATTSRLFVIAGVLGVVLLLGLYLLLALRMRAGRPWARLVLAVFAAFGLANFLVVTQEAGVTWSTPWNLLDVALCSAAVVYLYQTEARAYFQPVRGARGGRDQ